MDCFEDEPQWVDGTEVPVDTSMPNPNDMEFDNLYLVSDFNIDGRISTVCCMHALVGMPGASCNLR